MNTRCSLEQLQAALAGTLPADAETALAHHLETCEECATALERMAGGPESCREAASLLVEDELDAATPSGEGWSEIDFVVEHLEPADDPGLLGRLGGYDVLEVIGRGGMGVVLKAFDPHLKRCVAIKVLAPHLAQSSLARQRFARESQAAAAVVHPNVLAIHQVQPQGRLPFLVMPLVAGQSLAERLAARGPLELKEILRIALQAAAGLAAAHEQGLVHRDVKPANILLEKGIERAVLTDFGLARAADDVALTRWGIIAGTPEYMSPEQARGEPLDGRSDLFSLGCVMYEMATGVSPFRADSIMATLRRLVDEQPIAIGTLNPESPPWFVAMVERLLEKDPARRFGSAKEVSQLLEGCLAHLQQPASVPLPAGLPRRVRRPIRPRSKKIIIGALAMFTAAAGLLSLFLLSAAPPDISGEWSGEDWGHVVLKKSSSTEYSGTYTDTLGAQAGEIELKWSHVEHRFNGNWHEGTDRFGELSIRLAGQEIRGAFTTDAKSKINPATPRLADLAWTKAEIIAAKPPRTFRTQVPIGHQRRPDADVSQPGGTRPPPIPDANEPPAGSNDADAVASDAVIGELPAEDVMLESPAEDVMAESPAELNAESSEYEPNAALPLAITDAADSGPIDNSRAAQIASWRFEGDDHFGFRLGMTLPRPRYVVLGEIEFVERTSQTPRRLPGLDFYFVSPDNFSNSHGEVEWAQRETDINGVRDTVLKMTGNNGSGGPFMVFAGGLSGGQLGLFAADSEEVFWQAAKPIDPFWIDAEPADEKSPAWREVRLFEAYGPNNKPLGFIQARLRVCTMLPAAQANWNEPKVQRMDFGQGDLARLVGINRPQPPAPSRAERALAAASPQNNFPEPVAPKPVLRIVMEGDDETVTALAYSPDGKLLAAGGSRGHVGLYDPESGKLIRKLELFNERELASLQHPPSVPQVSPRVRALAFSPDSSALAVGNDLGQVKLFDAKTGELKSVLDHAAHQGDGETPDPEAVVVSLVTIHGIAFSPDGIQLATCGTPIRTAAEKRDHRTANESDGFMELWDARTGKFIGDLKGDHNVDVHAIAFSPDGKYLASANHWSPAGAPPGACIQLWDPHTLQVARVLPLTRGRPGGEEPLSIAFSPDSSRLAVGIGYQRGGAINVFDPASGAVNNTWFVGTAVRQVAFSADGKLIGAPAGYTAYNGISTVWLWDAASGHPAELMRSGGIHAKAKWNCLAFEPRGQRVATGGGEVIKAESTTDPSISDETGRIATVTVWDPEQIARQNRSAGE